MGKKNVSPESPSVRRMVTPIWLPSPPTLICLPLITQVCPALILLSDFAFWLDDTVGNVYAVNLIIGALSSIVDNVPLVAGAIGMYPVATDAMVAAATDPAYLANFMQDGVFWQFLAYCAGVGGSMLIIGSAAGVVVMGLERINFIWYLKNISLLALAGYLSGAVVYILQNLIL